MIFSAFVAEEIEPVCEILNPQIPWLFAGSSTLEMRQNLMKRLFGLLEILKKYERKCIRSQVLSLKMRLNFDLIFSPLKKTRLVVKLKFNLEGFLLLAEKIEVK